MKTIFKRRSIRKYKSNPVSDETVLQIVKAGLAAPSAGNQQPWHFLIINERKLLDDINSVHPYARMILEAPVAVMVCGDLLLETHPGYWVQDCAAATENMLIAATKLGLGSVWLGVYPRMDRVEAIKKLFKLPENIIPFAIVPLGYANEHKPAKTEFDLSRVRYNKWEK